MHVLRYIHMCVHVQPGVDIRHLPWSLPIFSSEAGTPVEPRLTDPDSLSSHFAALGSLAAAMPDFHMTSVDLSSVLGAYTAGTLANEPFSQLLSIIIFLTEGLCSPDRV